MRTREKERVGKVAVGAQTEYATRNAQDSGKPLVKKIVPYQLLTSKKQYNFLVEKIIKIFVVQDNLSAKERRRKRWKFFGEAAVVVVSRSVVNASGTMTITSPSQTLDLRPSRAR